MNNSSIVWMCPLTKTGKKSKARDAHAKCAQQFANENHFELIHTADNGDCFFNTLTKFALLTYYRPLLQSNNTNYNAKYEMDGHPNDRLLRQILVDHIEENLHSYIDFINNTNDSVENQLRSLRQKGVWDADIGDLVLPAGANAFRININLYNIEENRDRKDIVKLTKYVPNEPSDVYVNIMRINEGHFELLLPMFTNNKGNNRGNNKGNNREEKANSSCSDDAVAAALIATKAAQVAIDYAKKISNKNNNNVNVSVSLNRNENVIRNMTNQLEQLSMVNKKGSRRSSRLSQKNKLNSIPSQTRRSTRSSRLSQNQNEKRNTQSRLNNSYAPLTRRKKTHKKKINNNNMNNNMRAAIEASLRNQYN